MKTLAGKPSILAGSRRDFSHKSRQIKKKTNSKRTDDCQGRCIESWQQPGDSMMLALEPRLLFDAAGLVAGLDLLSCQNEVDPDCLTVEPDYGIMAPFDMFALAAPFEIESHSTIIFIDPGVADHENLISDSSADARVVVLDPAKDGIAQIDDVLSQCRDVSSVHIISHGTSGSITLGKTVLSNDTIDNYSASLQEWGTNLCKGADILIYGCNVAQGINGQAFVAQLSDITGADVAASTDVTGAEDRGGDWDLETRIGIIDSGLAVSVQAQADYANTLADITVNQNSDNRDVYMLNSIDDSDGINLREALFMAEKYYAGADTITFDNTLNGQTITLQYDALEINSSDGVIISGDIDGDGNYDITINGDGKYRVFTLGIDDNLTLSGLYITGGTDANKGGGIYAYRSTLALDNCKVGGNTVTSTVKDWEYGGGGIFTDRTTLYVTNCTISGNNTGARGGGLNIYDGTATISNSTISNNSSNDNGGGIVNYWADVTITDCTISNNSAALLGGGINSNTPVWKYVTISNSTISDNISDYAGGGICNSGNLDISNSTIAGNSATNDYYGNLGGWGGGIFNFSFGLDVKATITNSTISDNSADDLGGGIMNLKEMYVYDSTLTENTAPNGSGLYCYSAYWGVYNTYNTIGSSIVEGEIKLGINTITSQGDNLFEQETVPGADGASDILDAEIDLQPEGNDDSFDTNEDTAFTTGNVLSNDTDFLPPDTLTITSIDTSLTHGLVTNNNNGTFIYNPNGQFENLSNGETATDTFTYMISDGDGGTGSAMVTITISGINDNSFNPPEGNDDFYNTDEDTAFTTGNVLSNDTDFLPPDTLTITSIDTSLTHGLVTNNNDGTFIYNPNRQFENLSNGETATDTFTYMISDGDGGTGSAMVTITISGINDNSFFDGDTIKPNNPPEGGSDTFTIQEHTSFTVNVLLNDTDPDEDDTLTVTGMNTENTLGLITNNGEGIFTYDPNHQFDGLEVGETSTDTFTYTISDNNGGIDTITVTIIITGVKKSTTGLIFNTPSTEDSFADLFTDPQKTEIHWYQLWTGDEEGSQGDFVDTSAFYGPGNGWIETSNLTSLFPDYCQYDDTALWVRSWTADGGFSAWTFSTMPFQTIDTVVACSSISCTTSIDQMFNDENASSDYWYKIWIGDTAGETTNGSFLDTSSLNNQAATGWLRASELADISIDSGIPGSSLEFWAKAWSPFAGAYEWEHWTIDCIEETADAVLMKPDEELPAIGINIQKCIEKEVLIEDFQDHHTACYQVLSQNEMENNTFTADPLAGSIDEVMFVPGFREQLETAGSIFERQRTAFLGRICSTNKKT